MTSKLVKNGRIRKLNNFNLESLGPVVYWMSRDQRVKDNWALLATQELAKANTENVVVVFCLRTSFPYATERLVSFMLSGLEEVELSLNSLGIRFVFLLGEPVDEIPKFLNKVKASVLVRDFNPLRHSQEWNKQISKKINIPFFEVDAHNVVPVWVSSNKQEFGAYTIRPKIHKLLGEYLDEFPKISKQQKFEVQKRINWTDIKKKIKYDKNVEAVSWRKSGEKYANKSLTEFIDKRLADYDALRNDPVINLQSSLSPYLHFGQISAQRVALEVNKVNGHAASKNAFLEELIIRKELSDNYCFYNANYDNPKGFPEWAKKSTLEHSRDVREYLYKKQELEKGLTHDELWNAAQMEMVYSGKMHGYMRMYWAKKIMEWTKNVNEAMKIAIYLNDKYELDGRDPNGYTGIAWSMGGVHDRAWFERKIFGKIRFMSFNGAKSKFNVKQYIERVNALKPLK